MLDASKTCANVSRCGRPDRSAPALARSRRGFLQHDGARHMGADLPRQRPALGPRARRGRGAPVVSRPGGRAARVSRATSSSYASTRRTTWPRRRAGAACRWPRRWRRSAASAGAWRSATPANRSRPHSSAAPIASRAISARACCRRCPTPCTSGRRPEARCGRRWTCSPGRCCATTPGSRRCSTGCSMWPSSRSCASTSRPPRPRLRAGSGRPATLGSPPRSRRCTPTRPAVDGRRTGRARPPLSLRVRPPVHGAVGGAAARLPQRLADGAGSRTAARLRRSAGLDRCRARLRVGVLVRGGVQAPPRHRPGTLAPRGTSITT